MRIFIDEFLTSGGVLSVPTWGDVSSLACEGAAMVQAIAADFAQLAGFEVLVKRDARLNHLRFPECRVTDIQNLHQDRSEFRRLAAMADWTLVIAPEIDGMLLNRCQQAIAAGGRLLGPNLETIALASDKHQTAEFLRERDVPAPAGIALAPGEELPGDFPYPAVFKPRDGAGSAGVQWIADERHARNIRVERPSRLEQFCAGQPASVALLLGAAESQALPPFSQRLSRDGQYRYLGGERLQDQHIVDRARRLALQAVPCFPAARGYLGVDLVLGPAGDGSEDQLIEINPRLTTSYLGVRRSLRGNLAEALVASATGQPLHVEAMQLPIAFLADGTVAADFDSLPIVT